MPRSSAEDRVTIVTVAYNSTGVLPDMLASVPQGTPVVIVDNASDDRDRLQRIVAARQDTTRLVENERNLGFGAGCNKGAEQANTEFLLFLNPDTALGPDTLQKLIDAAERHSDASAFNPRILDEAGTAVVKRRTDLVDRSKWLPKHELTKDTVVPVLSGAALFVRRRAFEAVGGFDSGIFLFFEDDDLSLRLSRSRGHLVYVADAVVHHAGGASSGGSLKSERIKNWHWGYSQIYTTRKHGMRGNCYAAILKTGIRALSPATIFSSRRRQKYFARFSGMIAALRQNDS
ncbi:MAG: glycosyltransferase family 2 protein [Roseovarius confluentis]|jgi:N-acetylglucosaminyl-diphospho-decaprenol L-rhamnosyltransferase